MVKQQKWNFFYAKDAYSSWRKKSDSLAPKVALFSGHKFGERLLLASTRAWLTLLWGPFTPKCRILSAVGCLTGFWHVELPLDPGPSESSLSQIPGPSSTSALLWFFFGGGGFPEKVLCAPQKASETWQNFVFTRRNFVDRKADLKFFSNLFQSVTGVIKCCKLLSNVLQQMSRSTK